VTAGHADLHELTIVSFGPRIYLLDCKKRFFNKSEGYSLHSGTVYYGVQR